jgi:hypothetical protein
VDGVAEGVKETGGNVAESTRAAARGALQTAATLGTLAVEAVRQVMAGLAEGVDEITKARKAPAKPSAKATASRKASPRGAAAKRPAVPRAIRA